MDKSLQKKLVGAAVLIALVVIFLPMLLDGERESEQVSVQIEIPEKPVYEVPNRLQQPAVSAADSAPTPVEQPASPEAALTAPTTAPQVAEEPTPATASATATPQASNAPIIKPVAKPIKPEPAKQPKVAAKSEKAPKKPAVATPATDGAGYVVQVGSFSQKKNANQLKDKLAGNGFPAFVQTVTIQDKSIYRVKVGPRPTRDAVDQLRLRLIDQARLEGIIVKHP